MYKFFGSYKFLETKNFDDKDTKAVVIKVKNLVGLHVVFVKENDTSIRVMWAFYVSFSIRNNVACSCLPKKCGRVHSRSPSQYPIKLIKPAPKCVKQK